MALTEAAGYQLETRISSRARRLRIEVRGPETVRLVLPRRCSMHQAEAFLAQHRDWIERQRQRLQARPQAPLSATLPWDGHAPLPLHGQLLPVRHTAHRFKRPAMRLEYGQWICLSHPGQPLDQAGLTRLARTTLAAEAGRSAARMLAALSAETGLQPIGLRISDTRAQWGSCSAHGVVQLCWRLVCAPPEVMRYVVIHELCHLRHRNHSPRFWALVASFCPDYATHRAWLRREGPALMRLLPLP
ncbi:M48 family metallopeptidase [Polycyclovorans algicola]|uniref:M48 family metallopeptidase n=1 Tax=Polycyclovorans algicola TaxID=616992 RepID=UPI000694E086|nr:SprT family zinc-dependent metalloprotease [Polycyclovorans algicola]